MTFFALVFALILLKACFLSLVSASTHNIFEHHSDRSNLPSAEIECALCGGDEFKITSPDAIVDITDEDITCQELDELMREGGVPPEWCPLVPLLTFDICGCSTRQDSEVPTSAPSTNPNTCYVCGMGKSVGLKVASIDVIGGGRITCGELEDRGIEGELAKGDCVMLPNLISGTCQCRDNAEFNITNPECSICGENMVVNNLDGVVNIVGPGVISCSQLEAQGFAGQLSTADCLTAPSYVRDACDCIAAPNSTEPQKNLKENISRSQKAPLTSSLLSEAAPPSSKSAPHYQTIDMITEKEISTTLLDTESSFESTHLVLEPSSPVFTKIPVIKCGEESSAAQEVNYFFEAVIAAETSAKSVSAIITSFETALSTALLTKFFRHFCASQVYEMQDLNLSNITGVSTRPGAKAMEEVNCNDIDREENKCIVFKGGYTLYLELGKSYEYGNKILRHFIQDSLSNGVFDNLDERLVSVRSWHGALAESVGNYQSNEIHRNYSKKSNWDLPVLVLLLISTVTSILVIFIYRHGKRSHNLSIKQNHVFSREEASE